MKKTIKDWWKKHKMVGITVVVLALIVLVSQGVRSNVSWESLQGSAIREDFTVTAKAVGNTLDLDWTSYANVNLYTVYYSPNEENLINSSNIIEEIESFGLSLTPLKEGYYAISADTGLRSIKSNVVRVEK